MSNTVSRTAESRPMPCVVWPTVHAVAPERGRGRLAATRMLIIDDSTLQRENLAAVLREGGAKPAVAWDLPSVRVAIGEVAPQVVLLSMTTRDSIALLCGIRRACPTTRVIAVCVAEDEAEIIACAESGVAGYHLRSQSLDELLTVIVDVIDGQASCSPGVSAVLMRHLSAVASRRSGPRDPDLTTREMEILRMLEMGLTNRDIANQLCITLHTVKNHVHSVLSKLGVRSRAEAAACSRTLHQPARARN
ncbi:response regulator transcription factor [Mycobacterium sp. NAZ190054]|uniref:LuxR C-terminal-related transcriptional regulator n=1 Tax=Mycobacterium sp. NAZ190054 TaxID=1747766 RepID=UPI0018D22A51|nr:response regulator transcription factor [Mycobacterium sp. NAZ190054]